MVFSRLGKGFEMLSAIFAAFVGAAAAQDCHPSYEGECVPIANDAGCAAGSGNGPVYVSGPVRVVGDDEYRLDGDGAELPLDARDIPAPRTLVLAEAEEGYAKTLWATGPARPSRRSSPCRRQWSGRLYLSRNPGRPGGRHRPEAAGGVVPQRIPFRRARGRAHAAQHPVREVWRAEVPRCGARQGCARLPAPGAEPERPHRRFPHPAAAAGNWPLDRRSADAGDVRGAGAGAGTRGGLGAGAGGS